jgi:hypothetical protein
MTGLEQKDIDELLNNMMNGDDSEEESSNKTINPKEKVYRVPRKPIIKNIMPYRSPVVKREDVIYNPKNDILCEGEKIVVRSLGNYIKYIMKEENSK